MTVPHPQTFYADLSDDRLRVVAASLLDVRSRTFQLLDSDLDCNYVKESAAFGRCRNKLIGMCKSNTLGWMQLLHGGMDVTFTVGDVPCRFFRDDADSPEKHGFFRRNNVDDLFAEDDAHPVMWRFVVEKALTEDDEDRVLFVGYNVYQEKVAEWQYRDSAPTLHSVDNVTPPSTLLPKVDVALLEDEQDSAKDGTTK